MKKVYIIATVIAGIFLVIFVNGEVWKGTNDSDGFPQGYKIISPEIPKSLNFAGEEVPLDQFDIYERIDKEFIVNTYFHSYTILTMKRANRWFPVIEPILKKYHVPDDFKYIAVIESGLENVVSPKGAKGFWQLTDGAAKKYGLEVNDVVDERYDVEKSTEAACKFFLDADTLFGSWTMAAAAYNFGINGLTKQIQKQKSNNYYNLVLGDETERYIPRAIAVKGIFNNPAQYGFDIKKQDLYLPLSYKIVSIDSSVSNLADFAMENGINYKILKLYNPWLRDNFIINKAGKTYQIKIPTGTLKEN